MKKLYILLSLALSVAFSGCADFLEEDVRGTQNLNNYFQTEDEAESYVNGCYQALTYDGWWQVYKFYNLVDMCTDDCWMGNTSQDQGDYISLAHYQGTGQSNGAIENFWQYRYRGILRCNVAIDKLPNAPIRDEAVKNRLIAEVRFLRGFFYFDLVKNFGDIPLMTGFLMPDEVDGITRSSASTVYEFIEADLKAAADVLPQRSAQASSEVGRATRGAALGLLGKAYLYQEKWQDAHDALKTIIDEGEYDLLSDFGDVWDIDSNNSKESLFEVQHMYNATYSGLGGSLSIMTGMRQSSDTADGWAWCQPTSDLENAFKTAGDDVRLKWTIIKTGATEIPGEDQFETFVTNGQKQSSYKTYAEKYGWSDNCCFIDPGKHKSARVNRKFFVPMSKRPEKYDQPYVPLNHRILRYADVLLMYAEACNELNQDSEAKTYLNKVRNRAGLTDVTTTGSALRKAIRTERRLELALEENRLFDIRRWKDDNGKKVICNIMGPNGTFVKYNTTESTADPYEWNNQGERSDKGISFDETRDVLFPIPLHEITMSGGTITQNPGWN